MTDGHSEPTLKTKGIRIHIRILFSVFTNNTQSGRYLRWILFVVTVYQTDGESELKGSITKPYYTTTLVGGKTRMSSKVNDHIVLMVFDSLNVVV